MAQIFYVTCPACRQRFPCHPELWDAGYDLLCPFCQASFPQEASPLLVTGTGEQRAGRLAGGAETGPATQQQPPSSPGRPPDIDPNASAESM
jgi:hypothetical protein